MPLLLGTFLIALLLGAFPAGAGAFADPVISGGQSFNCAVSDVGSYSCWGSSWASIMGSVPSGSNPAPLALAPGAGAVSIATGGTTNCVLFATGKIKCWGADWDGELGRGLVTSGDPNAVEVTGISNATGVWSGSANAFCARLADATAKCWGDGNHKSLGDGGTADGPVPVVVSGVANVKKIVPGNGGTTCALIADGTIKCWGYNIAGQVGNNTSGADVGSPATVSGITNAIDIAVGNYAVCALLATHQVSCWGDNFYGSLGTGESAGTEHHTPVAVPAVAGATQITGSGADFCALMADTTVKCWGLADTGETGTGTNAGNTYTPVAVPGVSGIAQLPQSFSDAVCAMKQGGAVICWGADDYGQSGVAPTKPIVGPSEIASYGLISARAAVASSVKVTPKPTLDKKHRYFKFAAQLAVTPDPVVLASTACSGAATLKVAYTTTKTKHHKKVKVVHSKLLHATVTQTGATCAAVFSKKLSAKTYARRKLSLTATVPANAAMLAVTSPVKHYKMPKLPK